MEPSTAAALLEAVEHYEERHVRVEGPPGDVGFDPPGRGHLPHKQLLSLELQPNILRFGG